MLIFIFLGVAMGIYGAIFCKLNILWSKTFRQLDVIRRYPVVEVLLVVLTTATVGWYNRYTRISGTRLVEDLLSECVVGKKFDGVCPDSMDDIPGLLALMGVAVVIKAALYLTLFIFVVWRLTIGLL
jgi:chloride channel 3/4/5